MNSIFALTLGYLNPALNNLAQGAQQRISIKKLGFPTHPRAKVRHQGHWPLAQPCFQECLELLQRREFRFFSYLISTSFLALMTCLESSYQRDTIPWLALKHPVTLKALDELCFTSHCYTAHNLTKPVKKGIL